MSTFRMGVDIAGLLQSIEADKQAVAESVRPAAQAGAQVLYDEVKRRAPKSDKTHYFYGSQFKKDGTFYGPDGSNRAGPITPYSPGNLQRSIYQKHVEDADKTGPAKATYQISWNRKKAPYGGMVEFGHFQKYEVTYDKQTQRFVTHKDRPLPSPKHIAAKPFIRPARDKMPQALAAIEARFFEELKKRGVTG